MFLKLLFGFRIKNKTRRLPVRNVAFGNLIRFYNIRKNVFAFYNIMFTLLMSNENVQNIKLNIIFYCVYKSSIYLFIFLRYFI